jgi:hypothetical protein
VGSALQLPVSEFLPNIKEKPKNYTLSTCSGRIVTSGKRAKGFIIESIHRQVRYFRNPCRRLFPYIPGFCVYLKHNICNRCYSASIVLFTEICGNKNTSKSCAKILPLNVYHKDNPENIVQMYAVIDDQSNRSLASPEFFNLFNIKEKPENYTLSTCSGRARSFKCGKCITTSGVGIPARLFGMYSHSIRTGNSNRTCLCIDSNCSSEETLLRPIMCSTNDLDHLERHMPSN